MATTDIGRAVPLLRGEYDPAQTYELNDIVSLNGSLYWHYSHEVTTNVAPQATSTWKIVLSLTDAEAYIARAETAAEEAESAKDDAVTAKTAAETASATATGASEAATAAKDDAVTARNAAQTAETGAVEAKNAAVSAKEAAQSAASSAGTSATSAGNSAGTAEYYAENAETAAETATTKASEASASATTASSAATTATEAKNTAVSSASTATTKAGEASTSATSAASSAAAAQAVKDSIPEDYSELSEDVSELKTQLTTGREKESVDITWSGGYVNLNGLIVASQYSGFVLVPMHENESVKIGTADSNITMVGTTTASSVTVGDTITPIYKTSTSGTYEEYTFTATSDINIVLCVALSNYKVEFTDDIGIVKTIKQNYVTKDSIDFVDVEESKNIFNPQTITPGYIVNNSGGHDNTSYYAVSDYIPVSAGDIIRATPFADNADVTYQLYDNSKTWVTGTRWTQTAYDGYLEITIPNGISYVTVNLRGSNSNNVVVTKNTAFDASYGGTYGKAIGLSGVLYKGKLYGKKIVYNGDSICESRIVSGTASNGGAYAHLIAEATGAKYENRAISGGILASAVPSGETMPQRSVVSDVTNMAADADLICFEGGINDYWKNVPLGDYSESDYSRTLDTTTVCGALESIFRQATDKWVGKPIVFIIVHKIKSTVYLANTAGYTFAQEREKMIGICNKYAIPYYDAFAESGLNAYNDIQNTTFLTSNSTGTPDGCHPNESGYRDYYVPQLIALFESVMP